MQDFNLMRKNINKEEKSIMNYFEEATLKIYKIDMLCLFILSKKYYFK